MKQLPVLNMQTESAIGWIARAFALGLEVSSRSEVFGDEVHLIKDSIGNFVEVTQNTSRSRMLRVDGFTASQMAIVRSLQDSGLIQPDRRTASRPFASESESSREHLTDQASWKQKLTAEIEKRNLLASVASQMSLIEPGQSLQGITVCNTEFLRILSGFEAGVIGPDDVRRASAQYAALILATARRHIALASTGINGGRSQQCHQGITPSRAKLLG